jgi:hypothetical protein
MVTDPAQPQGPQLPILYGAKIGSGGSLVIGVTSNGCTDASNFSVEAEQTSPNLYRLTVTRLKDDRCRMATHLIKVTLPLPAVANARTARFVFANKLAPPDKFEEDGQK